MSGLLCHFQAPAQVTCGRSSYRPALFGRVEYSNWPHEAALPAWNSPGSGSETPKWPPYTSDLPLATSVCLCGCFLGTLSDLSPGFGRFGQPNGPVFAGNCPGECFGCIGFDTPSWHGHFFCPSTRQPAQRPPSWLGIFFGASGLVTAIVSDMNGMVAIWDVPQLRVLVLTAGSQNGICRNPQLVLFHGAYTQGGGASVQAGTWQSVPGIPHVQGPSQAKIQAPQPATPRFWIWVYPRQLSRVWHETPPTVAAWQPRGGFTWCLGWFSGPFRAKLGLNAQN